MTFASNQSVEKGLLLRGKTELGTESVMLQAAAKLFADARPKVGAGLGRRYCLHCALRLCVAEARAIVCRWIEERPMSVAFRSRVPSIASSLNKE